MEGSKEKTQAEWILGNSNSVKKFLTYYDYLKIVNSFWNWLCIQKILNERFDHFKKSYEGKKKGWNWKFQMFERQ